MEHFYKVFVDIIEVYYKHYPYIVYSSDSAIYMCVLPLSPDKVFFSNEKYQCFLFVHENVCYGYSFEVPLRGASDEYPQHKFSWRNKKKCYDRYAIWSLSIWKKLGNYLILKSAYLFVLRFHGPVHRPRWLSWMRIRLVIERFPV